MGKKKLRERHRESLKSAWKKTFFFCALNTDCFPTITVSFFELFDCSQLQEEKRARQCGGWSVVALWWCHSLMTNDTTDPPSLTAGLRLKYLQKWNRRCNCICIQAFKVIFQEIFWFLMTEGREMKNGSGSTLSSCQKLILNCFWYIQTLPIVHSKSVYLSAWWCQNDVISVVSVCASVFDRTVCCNCCKVWKKLLFTRQGGCSERFCWVASWESWELNMDTNSTTISLQDLCGGLHILDQAHKWCF